jgi:glycosyltransferase involved in cell wall biosynthesis
MKKVTIITRWPVGGIKTYINYIYRDGFLEKYRYSIVTPTSRLSNYFKSIFGNSLDRYEETVDTTSKFSLSSIKEIIESRPNLVHTHGLISALVVAPVCKLLMIPHIATLHDVFLSSKPRGLKGKFRWWAMARIIRMPTVINPCGYEAGENLIASVNVPEDKVFVIQNGVDSIRFSTDEVRDLRAELGISYDKVLVGFFGRFMKQKGFDLIVDMFNSRDDLEDFHIVCFGWGGFIREEQERIERFNLGKYFTFMPHTDEMAQAIRGVDIVLIPSRWEACPLLPMEALISGTPVLAADCIGMKEICDKSPARLFESKNIDQMADSLKEMKTVLQDCKEKSSRYRKQAAERFDAARARKKLFELYDSILVKK